MSEGEDNFTDTETVYRSTQRAVVTLTQVYQVVQSQQSHGIYLQHLVYICSVDHTNYVYM